MTRSDKIALSRLLGSSPSPRASTDELQGLLLQVVFALLMVFMIAYFMFVVKTEKEQQEQVMQLNRQKLTLALDKVVDERCILYGLNALMTQGVDGKRSFDASEHVQNGQLTFTPAVKKAFSLGSRAAATDYADQNALQTNFMNEAISIAGIEREALSDDEVAWFNEEVASRVELLRLDVRGVQRAIAARLQQQWIKNPATLSSMKMAGQDDVAAFAAELEAELKRRSLELISKVTAAEMLP
jgi:hypothetical protein